MQPVSKFRGTSGEIVRGYISPFTYFSALPIAIGLLLLEWLSNKFGNYGSYILFILSFVFISMATFRFALPTSRGESEPSDDLGEILVYSARYVLLNILWFVPWILLLKLLSKGATPLGVKLFVNPMVLLQSPSKLLFGVFLLLIPFILPTLCLLITLYSSSFKGLFRSNSWHWLLKQRRDDLAPYLSSMVGGSFVMCLISFLPVTFLTYVGFKYSSQTGLYLFSFLYHMVIATFPLLNGRLAGVFVVHDFVNIDFIEEKPLTLVGDEQDDPQEIAPIQQIEPRPDLGEIEKRLEMIAETEIASAISAAQELENTKVAPMRGQIEQTFLLIRSGDIENALLTAAQAIDGTAQRGFVDISLKLFERLGVDRRKIKLSAYSLEILGNMYQKKQQLLDAAWCFHAAATTSGDTIKAQKRIFQVAELAEKNAKFKEANALYVFLIKQYPNSTLSEFAQQGIARTKE